MNTFDLEPTLESSKQAESEINLRRKLEASGCFQRVPATTFEDEVDFSEVLLGEHLDSELEFLNPENFDLADIFNRANKSSYPVSSARNMSTCPRCGECALEHLKTYCHCANCLYSPEPEISIPQSAIFQDESSKVFPIKEKREVSSSNTRTHELIFGMAG